MQQDPGSQCVHCGGAIDSAPFHDGRLMRCGRCAFVYPRASRRLDDPIQRDSDLIPGERYRLIAPLHAHGAGRVYLARHLVLDEPCVVKVLSTGDPEFSPAACERFKSEAKAGFKIKHPNVARVLDCDRSGDEWYFVMEYVDGANLGEVVRECGRLAWTQVAHLGIGAADGLSAIHAVGLLHRDIKPSNLILGSDGSVKIADLGLVDILRGPQAGAGSPNGSGYGTPHYMPPEQRDGRVALDERADLYALGATLYHLLVGHPLSHGRGPLDYLTGGDERSPVDWPRDVTPPIPKWLRQIVEKCLASDREQRFASAEDLSAELSDWFASAEPSGADWQVPGIGTPRGVVVLPFENLSSQATDDWMGNALAEQIHNTLLGIEGVQVVDRHELLSLLGKMYAEQPSEVTVVHRLDAAKRVGAAHLDDMIDTDAAGEENP
ncbi:MAG: protein kinase [Acidobacteria bacterium]|nr:protein kinase [Acidobacteriota bacterium]